MTISFAFLQAHQLSHAFFSCSLLRELTGLTPSFPVYTSLALLHSPFYLVCESARFLQSRLAQLVALSSQFVPYHSHIAVITLTYLTIAIHNANLYEILALARLFH